MTIEELATKLVSDVLIYFQSFISRYDWRGNAFFRISIGSDGMEPEVTILLRSGHKPDEYVDTEIQFWLHPKDDEKFVFICDSYDPQSNEIDHESLDIQNINDVDVYFEKVAKLLKLERTSEIR